MPSGTAIITTALRKLGVLAGGISVSGTMALDALSELNRLLEAWALESVEVTTTQTLSLAVSQGTVTIGPTGAMVVTPRPIRLGSMYIRQSQTDSSVWPISRDDYADIANKTGGVSWVSPFGTPPGTVYGWYEPTLPNGTLTLWPIPTSGTLFVQVELSFAPLATPGASITLPPGYEELAIHDLAERLAPEYGLALPPELVRSQQNIRARIRRANSRPAAMRTDPHIIARRTWGAWSRGY